MKQLIEKASEGIVKRCEKLYTEIKKVQASLPRGGYETDFNLVNDPEIRGTMRRNEVNYNDAVCMVHEKPLSQYVEYDFIAFHQLDYSQRYRVVLEALNTSHRFFVLYLSFAFRSEQYRWEDSFDHAWDSPISGYAIEEIRDDIKEHVAELQDYAD